MSFILKDAGVWKPTQGWVRDAGVWKPFNLYVRDAGVWKLINELKNNGKRTIAGNQYLNASAGIRIDTDGSQQDYKDGTYTDIGDWKLSGTASSYECKIQKTSGDTIQGLSENTWYTISSNRHWYISSSTFKSYIGRFYIREIADTNNQIYFDVDYQANGGA